MDVTARVLDIVAVTDTRFQGGTGAAVAAEIEAAVRAGYSVGLAGYEAINIRQPLPFNPRLRRLIDRGDVMFVQPGTPVEARLAILHSPFAAGLLPAESLRIAAEERLLVVHHPPVDATGAPSYDLAATRRNAEEILAGPVTWAPVGPSARAAFRGLKDAPALAPDDWTNAIDFEAWRRRKPPAPRKGRLTIGRHSRPDLRKFPASRANFAAIYGDGSEADVDLLGCPPDLNAILAPLAPGWRLRPFGEISVKDHLDGLDAFVYYHREDWIEAFGYAVLEALARGVPCILPPSLGPCFGEAARICKGPDAHDAAREVAEVPGFVVEAGWDFVRDRHSYATVARRLESLIGPPRKSVAPAVATGAQPGVLLLSTNGIGMGHLTRTIAIARRIQAPLRPVVVTMSQAAAVTADFGIHTEFIPYHSYLGVDSIAWNYALRDELTALIDAFDARVILFDGNSPFQGLADALRQRPAVWGIWSRRGMWQPDHGREFLARESWFDAVIEPRDLAGAFDNGPTRSLTDITRHVDPVRLLDDHELLPREMARSELGIDPAATAVLVQLGSGSNYDMRLARDLVLRRLGGREGVDARVVDWMISNGETLPDLPGNVRRMTTFPVARHLAAFDATVAAVGYNSFHETMQARLPAVLVPNENPFQDNQLARARFAERRGAAIVARREEPERLVAAIEALLDATQRARMRAAAATLASANGAVEAARIVAHLAATSRGLRG